MAILIAVSTASLPPEQKKTRSRSPGVSSASLSASSAAGGGGEGVGGDVGQLAGLLGHRLGDLGPAVPGVDHPEAGDDVEVLPAVDVVELDPLASLAVRTRRWRA